MPTSASTEEKPKKRAPRKRVAATKSVRKKAPRKVARKRVVRKAPSVSKDVDRRESSGSTRRAPTPIAANRASGKVKQKQHMIVFAAVIVSIGLSAAVGLTDKGQIDVNREIEERNERIRSGQSGGDGSQNILVPVQNTAANQLPDGGLVGLGIGTTPPAPAPAPEPATTTASSTDETSSSTESSVEEEVETETDSEDTEDPEEIIEPEPTSGEEIVVEPISGR